MLKPGWAAFLLLTTLLQATFNNANAADSGFDIFQMPEIDTSSLSEQADDQWQWKNTASYSVGVDDQQDTIINRVSWRLQTEKLVENIFWRLDTKLRLYDDHDMQHDTDNSIDYDLNINALYAQYSADAFSLTSGYQTIGFGFMDLINVSKLLTPQDFSEAVFTAPEDSRIGQPIINISWYLQNNTIDFYINLHAAENRYPRSNLQQIVNSFLGSNNVELIDGLPDAFESPEAALRWQQQSAAHEYQLIIASLLQNDPNLKPVSLVPPFKFELEYPRYQLATAAYSYTSGNQQLKIESSYKNDIKPLDAGNQILDETTLGLGWEYNANGAYTLLLETAHAERSLPENITGLLTASQINKQSDQHAISWRKNFFNETLAVNLYYGLTKPGDLEVYSTSLQYTPIDDQVYELIITDINAKDDMFNIFTSYLLLKASYYW